MSPTPTLSEVLVTGAGPTGLTMAIELARRGIPVRVIDKAAAPDTRTRALGMQARTLELFERHRIGEQLQQRGLRADSFNVFSEGRQIVHADFRHLDTHYPYLLMIPQNHAEEILIEKLATYGVTVERNVSLTELTQTPDAVTVSLVDAAGDAEQARFTWVIGADGAHSTVRHQLGLAFIGTSFEENFTVADLRVDWQRPHEEFFAFLNRGRFSAFFPMLEGWHRVAIARPVDDPRSGEVTHDELQIAVDECVPGSTQVTEVRQAGRFRINQRRAAAHSVGRVFLIGDAAHIHSVVGAQGMNTGIQDAFNLGWKLAAVIQRKADRSLLDSYGAERAPVADRLVRGTRRITNVTLLSNPVTTLLRRRLAPIVAGRTRMRTQLTRAVSQLDISYHDDSGAAPPERAEVGDRAPDAPLFYGADGVTRVFDVLDDHLHTLLCFDLPADAAPFLEEEDELVRVVRLNGETRAAARYGLTGPSAILVRPDGYIAERTVGSTEVPTQIFSKTSFVRESTQ